MFREQLAPAGIRLNINLVPAAQSWEVWDKTPFGITAWTHRSPGTMVLSLSLRCGVPWNKGHYCNPEVDAAPDAAAIDVEEWRRLMEKVETILQHDAVMVQPLWTPKFFVASAKLKSLCAHPIQYHQFHRVWLEA